MKTASLPFSPALRRPAIEDAAARVLRRCDELAACSDEDGQITRLFLSPALKHSHALVGGWMREAGLNVRVDEVGNLIGRLPASARNAPVFMLGSHLDTVPNAGRYDGALGVILAIEAAAMFAGARSDDEPLPFALEVLGFSDEEGVRYGARCLGSRALIGDFEAEWLDLLDEADITMSAALREFGLEPNGWPGAQFRGRALGYLEAHIEQGPVLQATDQPLGLVSAIAGQTRLRLRFLGQAGHAGTQPMTLRRDALPAASEWILAVEERALDTEDLVATVGLIDVEGAASNVVPGAVVCTLDARHPDDEERRAAVGEMISSARRLAARRGVGVEVVFRSEQDSVPMDEELRDRLEQAAREIGIEAPTMVSGAGHDAAFTARIAPSAVLFLRTPGGQSHNPAEDVTEADIALALETMHHFLEKTLAQSRRETGDRRRELEVAP